MAEHLAGRPVEHRPYENLWFQDSEENSDSDSGLESMLLSRG